VQSKFPDIAAGNQQGFVLKIQPLYENKTANDPSLAITKITQEAVTLNAILTIPNHNLQTGQFIKLSGINGLGSLLLLNFTANVGLIYYVEYISANTIYIKTYDPSGVYQFQTVAGEEYLGGGQVTVYNRINIQTKQFSPFYEQGSQCRLAYIDFFATKTTSGEFTANLTVDCNPTEILSNTESRTGTNIVSTAPEN